MIYKIHLGSLNGINYITRENLDGSTTSFSFSPDNTDYQNFKKQINADEAQLEDADGNLMTAEQAKEFVKELP